MAKKPAASPFEIPASLIEAGAIAAIAPWVFAARMSALGRATPYGAYLDLQRFASEKAVAAFKAGVDVSLEATKQAVAVAGGARHDAQRSANRIAEAALKPVAAQVRKNASKRG